jgi:hypothetical protein
MIEHEVNRHARSVTLCIHFLTCFSYLLMKYNLRYLCWCFHTSAYSVVPGLTAFSSETYLLVFLVCRLCTVFHLYSHTYVVVSVFSSGSEMNWTTHLFIMYCHTAKPNFRIEARVTRPTGYVTCEGNAVALKSIDASHAFHLSIYFLGIYWCLYKFRLCTSRW